MHNIHNNNLNVLRSLYQINSKWRKIASLVLLKLTDNCITDNNKLNSL